MNVEVCPGALKPDSITSKAIENQGPLRIDQARKEAKALIAEFITKIPDLQEDKPGENKTTGWEANASKNSNYLGRGLVSIRFTQNENGAVIKFHLKDAELTITDPPCGHDDISRARADNIPRIVYIHPHRNGQEGRWLAQTTCIDNMTSLEEAKRVIARIGNQ